MNLQPIFGTRSRRGPSPNHDGGALECLRCRHRFNVNDLSHVLFTRDDRSYIVCVWCEAHNEVRATRRLGALSPTVVLRIIGRGRSQEAEP